MEHWGYTDEVKKLAKRCRGLDDKREANKPREAGKGDSTP